MQSLFDKNIECKSKSKNLTFVGILLAGPSIDISEHLEPYYEFYHHSNPDEPHAVQRAAIHIHLEFMQQIIEELEKTKIFTLKDTNRIAKLILEHALNRTNHIQTSLKDTKADASAFVFHFFRQFNFFFQHVVLQSQTTSIHRRFSLGPTGKSSLLHRQLKSLIELQNPVAESIPSSGLWCSAHLHSFSEWLQSMDQHWWFIQFYSHKQNNIQFEIDCCKRLILSYHYQEFLHSICHNYPLSHCAHALNDHSNSLDTLKHTHEMHVPLKDRLLALTHFQLLISSRLHQLQEEARAQHIDFGRYTDLLYERGKLQHHPNEFSKDWTENLEQWKRLKDSHFVYDFETAPYLF